MIENDKKTVRIKGINSDGETRGEVEFDLYLNTLQVVLGNSTTDDAANSTDTESTNSTESNSTASDSNLVDTNIASNEIESATKANVTNS